MYSFLLWRWKRKKKPTIDPPPCGRNEEKRRPLDQSASFPSLPSFSLYSSPVVPAPAVPECSYQKTKPRLTISFREFLFFFFSFYESVYDSFSMPQCYVCMMINWESSSSLLGRRGGGVVPQKPLKHEIGMRCLRREDGTAIFFFSLS
jgi:hypothetical protein